MEDKDLKGVYEFAGFRLDPQKKRLSFDENPFSLTPKEYEILLLLIKNAGRVVEKDELLEAIWADTFVEEGTLTRNISWLRKKLAAHLAEDFKIIETLPKIGYRFLPQVSFREISDQPKNIETLKAGKMETIVPLAALSSNTVKDSIAVEAVSVAGQKISLQHQKTFSSFWAIAVLGIILVAGVIGYQYLHRASPTFIAAKIVPLSGLPGRETSPAFSPDGKQLVYAWNGGGENNNTDIYIKLIGSGESVRLTTNPADELNPVFSPDGASITFLRVLPNGNEIISIPALGGAERKIDELASYASFSFSPDGRTLAVVNLDAARNEAGIFLLDLNNGSKIMLTAPPAPVVDHTPRFAPDGKSLAFIRHFGTFRREIFVVPVSGGEARQITTDAARVYGLAWSADSRSLFFTSYRKLNQLNLWQVAANNGEEPQLIPTGSKNINAVALSPNGHTIAFVEEAVDENIWELAADKPPQPLIRSIRADHSQQFSPDGSQIVFASDRTGEYEIWLADADGKNQRRLTFSIGSAGSPRFSPDGKFVAYDVQTAGKSDVFVISVNGGEPRRLTEDDKNNFMPAWSLDGQTIFFVSNRSGSDQIWKIPFGGGESQQITKNGAFEIFAAPDGKSLVYSKGGGKFGLWQISVDGSDEKPISELAEAGSWRSWTVTRQGIYYTVPSTQPPYQIKFFDFASRQTKTVSSAEKSPLLYYSNLCVSPDGLKILYSKLDQSSETIFTGELEEAQSVK